MFKQAFRQAVRIGVIGLSQPQEKLRNSWGCDEDRGGPRRRCSTTRRFDVRSTGGRSLWGR